MGITQPDCPPGQAHCELLHESNCSIKFWGRLWAEWPPTSYWPWSKKYSYPQQILMQRIQKSQHWSWVMPGFAGDTSCKWWVSRHNCMPETARLSPDLQPLTQQAGAGSRPPRQQETWTFLITHTWVTPTNWHALTTTGYLDHQELLSLLCHGYGFPISWDFHEHHLKLCVLPQKHTFSGAKQVQNRFSCQSFLHATTLSFSNNYLLYAYREWKSHSVKVCKARARHRDSYLQSQWLGRQRLRGSWFKAICAKSSEDPISTSKLSVMVHVCLPSYVRDISRMIKIQTSTGKDARPYFKND
jgi:hypothetical protein